MCAETVPNLDLATNRGTFKPGHDQKLRIALEKRVGGLDGLREMVEAVEEFNEGSSSPEQLVGKVRDLFAKQGLSQVNPRRPSGGRKLEGQGEL